MSSKIGERIRDLRKSAGMTKQQLAVAASVDGAVLERLERENVNPSVPVMNRICQALGTRTGTVLDGAEFAGPVHTAPDTGGEVRFSDFYNHNLHCHLLAHRKSDRNMDPSIIDVVFAQDDAPRFLSHEGEEFVYVLEGSVMLRYGREIFLMKAGDSIYFDSCVPHALTTQSAGETARVLAVTYIPLK